MDVLCANMKGTTQSVAIRNQESAFWGQKISRRTLMNKGFVVHFRSEERGRKVKGVVVSSILTRDINKEMLVSRVIR